MKGFFDFFNNLIDELFESDESRIMKEIISKGRRHYFSALFIGAYIEGDCIKINFKNQGVYDIFDVVIPWNILLEFIAPHFYHDPTWDRKVMSYKGREGSDICEGIRIPKICAGKTISVSRERIDNTVPVSTTLNVDLSYQKPALPGYPSKNFYVKAFHLTVHPR